MSRSQHKPDQPAAVVGFGKTGKAVLDFFLEKSGNALYLFNDTPIGELDRADREKYQNRGVTFLVGEEQFSRLENVGLIVLSPGVDGRTPRFNRLREKGITIVSEIELASSLLPADIPIIAVTGTNGKSTTVSLVHHLISASGRKSFLAGNIGNPLIPEVDTIGRHPGSVVVLEVSSFQLEEIIHFRPHIGLLLNITPDHLDRYKTTAEYFSAKLNLVKNQERSDYLVLNADDPELCKCVHETSSNFGRAKRLWFSRFMDTGTGTPSTTGIDIFASHVGEHIHLKLDDKLEKISLQKNPLRGLHNLENILAAVTAARLAGVPARVIETALPDFKGLPHRMESAGTIGKVEFINDSKATNVDAAVKSIASITGPLVLILGGKDKGGDFTVLADVASKRVDQVLLIGQAAQTIQAQLKTDTPMERAANLGQAVLKGYQQLKQKGGVVLLAPGCASFDMFDNFEHRGEVFKQEVNRLKEKCLSEQT